MALNYYRPLFQLRKELLNEKISFEMNRLDHGKTTSWQIDVCNSMHECVCTIKQYPVSDNLYFTDEETRYTKGELSEGDALELIKDVLADDAVSTEGFKVFH